VKAQSEASFFGLMSLIAGLAVAIIIGGLLAVSGHIDNGAARREEVVVGNGFDAHVLEIASLVVPNTNWDDAVRNLDHDFDRDWADANIGGFFGGTDRFEAVAIVNGRDAPVYGWRGGHVGADWGGGQEVALDAYTPFVTAASDAIRMVRAAEISRGSLAGRETKTGLVSPPIQVSVIKEVLGAPYILIASLVQPDLGSALPSPRSAIVITARQIDTQFLSEFGSRYLLDGLSLGASTAKGPAKAAIRDPQGKVLAVMLWTPQRPGTEMLKRVMAPLALASLALFATIFIVWRMARRSNRGLVASEARAKHMAAHDALTGLPNRVFFQDRLGQALEASRRSGGQVAVLCIDLDRFKEVNDTFGHHCGDELICEAARRLASTCRAGESLARLGGDEFAVVQPDATPDSAARLAERIQQAVSGAVDISAGRVFLGCSVGVSVLHGADMDPGEVLRQADLALYQAKDRGRGCYCFFEPEMDAALRNRRTLAGDLRDAIDQNQLTMAYQPQVDGRGRLVGLEALVRWNHPTRGTVSPGFFVPIAEECGLIDALGFYTLKIAFTDSLRWPKLKMAVNLSASQLRIPDFIVRLKALVSELKVNPAKLELEITEGVLLGDDIQTHEVLNALRAMGFGLALDDFGTGYSSLSYLRRYPVNKIKIDRSFVSNLGVDKEADAMISAIVRLARALDLSVIAEGVETHEQRKLLSAAGCYDVQGFLFGKPTPREQIDELMKIAA
jgi:diguanylate cyclase (GGDEF)-like protein